MKSIFKFLLFFSCIICLGQKQKTTATKTNSIVFEADFYIGCDGFENYFYIKNNVLFKKNDAAILQYQNVSLGKLTKVDISNPLKIVLFYEEFNSVILLDNQLNEIQKINFSKNEEPIVASAVGLSGQNQLWIYNSLNQQIGLYDLNTGFYKNLGVPIKETFSIYQTDFNYFHWIDSQNNWISCSIYGRVFSHGNIDSFTQIQIIDNDKILYLKNNQLYFKDLSKDTTFEIEIVEKSFEKFYYKDQILSIFTNQGITNYKITIP